jgi:glutamate/tyrosine decarboxylase-like PLP-dependent enzyme
MDSKLAEDRDRLPALLAAIASYASHIYGGLDSAPVAVPPQELAAGRLAPGGIGAEAALRMFRDRVAPHLAMSAGPRHLGFVTGGATPAAVIGDWLATVFDQNPVSPLDGSAALQIERDTVAMLQRLVGLPDAFSGTWVSGATMSNFVGLAVAREWAGRACGVRVSDDGVSSIPRLAVLSSTPHSSTTKALSMLGLGRKTWRSVECLPRREAINTDALERALAATTGPCTVVASAGTVNSGDFDDFAGLARLKQAYRFYLHVDAAFGGFASVSPDLRPLLEGWTCADSICLDLHKWLNVPYDSAVAFTRHRDLQRDVFANHSAYLALNPDAPEPIHLAPENSHRWRALPAWFSLTAYGADGYREIVERNCRLARALADRIRQSDLFELLAPVRLNIVCFALRNPVATPRFIAAVRDGGRALVTPTVLWGTPAIRAAFSNWRTTADDLDIVWSALLAAAEAL